jgi:cyclase
VLKRRIIPCLDVKDGRVVKGVHFAGLRDSGDPIEAARAYDAQGADELCLLDITATAEGRDTFLEVVQRVAAQIFVPLTVGGGVRREADVRRLMLAGADKVAINSAAVQNPPLIRRLADLYGSQAIVISVDVRRDAPKDRRQRAPLRGRHSRRPALYRPRGDPLV